MFAQISPGTSRGRTWIALSCMLHAGLAALALCAWPEFVLTAGISTTQGRSGPGHGNYVVIYRRPSSLAVAAAKHSIPALRAHSAHSVPIAPAPLANPATSSESASAGNGLGPILRASAVWFPGIHEIRIALPRVTPNPDIKLGEIPTGFEGDVVVEITIDKEGKVVRTRVERAFGGLEKKVMMALMQWRFQPASYDGVPVASRQDIYFHYPDSATP